jgi:hypothetical protein
MARRRASACLTCGTVPALPGLPSCLGCHVAHERAAAYASGRSLGRAEGEAATLHRLKEARLLRDEYSPTHVPGPENVVPFARRKS